MRIPVLVLTGAVGVGKTSVASAISERLTSAGVAHALVDLDWLRWCYPTPPHDPFHMALGLQNLAAVGANYRMAGARRFILVDIVESDQARAEYRAAIPDAAILVVRLHASLPTLLKRLENREVGASLVWHQRRAAELADQMARQRLEDLLVDTEHKTVAEIATEVLTQIRW